MEHSTQQELGRQHPRHGKKRNVFHDRILEPFSLTPSRRPLMEKFKPPLPERLLPKDPHPNYLPMYLDTGISQNPNSPRDYSRRNLHRSLTNTPRTIHQPQILRPSPAHSQSFHNSPGGSGSASGSPKTGARCPHCLKRLAYAYNLSKHIENRHNIPTGLFHCRLCTYKAPSDMELRAHREARHRRCPHCNIRFDTERGMNRHIYDCPNRPNSSD